MSSATHMCMFDGPARNLLPVDLLSIMWDIILLSSCGVCRTWSCVTFVISGEQPHASIIHRRLDSTRPVTETRIKMVAAWKCLSKSTFFCSVLWLLLFTSSCDAVHPSAVYRSFHQNDRFTVPFSNSTLSPKCQAAYDRLRNSSVAESTVCK